MDSKKFKVTVKFRNSSDVSNPNKRRLIDALGGKYKVTLDELNNLNHKNARTFEFGNQESADGFANRLFAENSHVFDIKKVH
ncbi:hypothetical protein AF78_04905 [Aliarcobacter butzleri L353]|uniref:hypothetical protein n=1 Tax=Aliarcobacter butzleri TaxID=28197 RepID=UPI000659F815|nr:hypothetical protein [Aliarcobacter butzleri]KLE05837.1 hypothetical protein AF78_04905 [Aliarcobacter butzleri L353]